MKAKILRGIGRSTVSGKRIVFRHITTCPKTDLHSCAKVFCVLIHMLVLTQWDHPSKSAQQVQESPRRHPGLALRNLETSCLTPWLCHEFQRKHVLRYCVNLREPRGYLETRRSRHWHSFVDFEIPHTTSPLQSGERWNRAVASDLPWRVRLLSMSVHIMIRVLSVDNVSFRQIRTLVFPSLQ